MEGYKTWPSKQNNFTTIKSFWQTLVFLTSYLQYTVYTPNILDLKQTFITGV